MDELSTHTPPHVAICYLLLSCSLLPLTIQRLLFHVTITKYPLTHSYPAYSQCERCYTNITHTQHVSLLRTIHITQLAVTQ